MKTLPLLLLLTCFATTAQDYRWTVAKSGGGLNGLTNNLGGFNTRERVRDIAVDTNNNYYFLLEVGSGSVGSDAIMYDGNSITTYNTGNTSRDQVILSTDCDGNLRWSKTIGGGSDDYATAIQLDMNNNVYVAGTVRGQGDGPNEEFVHFDTDSIITTTLRGIDPGPHNKSIFMIKYDDGGNFQWLRQPQEDNLDPVDGILTDGSDFHVETDGTLHWLVYLPPGPYADGALTVPSNNGQGSYGILKYDGAGNYVSWLPLDMTSTGFSPFYSLHMTYDEVRDRYFIGQYLTQSSGQLVFNGTASQGSMMAVAVDGQGNQLWRHDNQRSAGRLHDLEVDANGNLYVCGTTQNFNDNTGGNDGDSFAGYQFDQVSPSGNGGDNGNYVIKLDPSGNLLWGNNSDRFSLYGLGVAVNGNEVALASGMVDNSWDGVPFSRPVNSNEDPAIVRLDAATGSVLGIEGTEGQFGSEDFATAIATDIHGNYVVGGYMNNTLFLNEPYVSPLDKNGGPSDFWWGRLARTDCQGQTFSLRDAETGALIRLYTTQGGSLLHMDGLEESSGFVLYDLSGRQVSSGRAAVDRHAHDIAALPKGLYIVRFADGRHGRFVK